MDPDIGYIIGVSKEFNTVPNFKSLPVLKASPTSEGRYVTFSDGKRQIRAALKKAGVTGALTFRPRSANRAEFSIPVDGGSIVADRKVGAKIRFVPAVVRQWSDLTPEEQAAILAIG